MSIPKSCGECKYGSTYDMSVDDLRSFCALLGYSQDWCDFPNRSDGASRVNGCPMPNPSKEQIKTGNKRLEIHKEKKKVINRAIHSKSFRVRKKNTKKFVENLKNINTGFIPREWFM